MVKLTKSQKEVLELLQIYTVKQVADRRGTSTRAVYKITKKLREIGVIDQWFTKTKRGELLLNKKSSLKGVIRLHGMQWSCRILHAGLFYDKSMKKGDWIVIDSHKVKLNRRSLDIYQSKDHSFFGSDANEVTGVAFDYWNRFFHKLEVRLRIVLIKNEHQNIRLVKWHYAELENELAKKARDDKKKINVYATEDGKLWFTIDYSFNVDEAETQHRLTAKDDADLIFHRHFNDLRDHDPPTNSELARHIDRVVGMQEFHAENIKSHVQAIKDLSKGVNELRSAVRGISLDASRKFGQCKSCYCEPRVPGMILFNGLCRICNIMFVDEVNKKFKDSSLEEKNRMLGLG